MKSFPVENPGGRHGMALVADTYTRPGPSKGWRPKATSSGPWPGLYDHPSEPGPDYKARRLAALVNAIRGRVVGRLILHSNMSCKPYSSGSMKSAAASPG
jgi:hypothetical protein